jgi:hypothetical protein
MFKRPSFVALAPALASLASLIAACQPYGSSRVASGQLYTAGAPAYDSYFHDVHQQQVDAAMWADDRRSAHKALVSALSLTSDAPDVTLVQGAHDAASKAAKQPGSVRLDIDGTSVHVVASGGASDGGALFRAIEDTAHSELERARKLHALEPKLEALEKQGGDLNTRAPDDFKTRGQMKQKEVQSELSSSVQVLGDLKSRANAEARMSEDFVADLERALETASEGHAKHAPKPKKDKGDDDAKPKPKPAVASEPKPAAEPKPAEPKPTPKPPETGEVFTP